MRLAREPRAIACFRQPQVVPCKCGNAHDIMGAYSKTWRFVRLPLTKKNRDSQMANFAKYPYKWERGKNFVQSKK